MAVGSHTSALAQRPTSGTVQLASATPTERDRLRFSDVKDSPRITGSRRIPGPRERDGAGTAGLRESASAHKFVIVGGGSPVSWPQSISDAASIVVRRDPHRPQFRAWLEVHAARVRSRRRELQHSELQLRAHSEENGFDYWRAELCGLDRETRWGSGTSSCQITGAGFPAGRSRTRSFAIGNQTNDFGMPGVSEHRYFMDEVGQAQPLDGQGRQADPEFGAVPDDLSAL
ncbi:hypothetical protein ACVWWO_003703 [Bradyrhizobium sp. F1.13.1]